MRDTFIDQMLRDLATSREQHCLSIYMPVLPGEPMGRENPIRLKNLLRSAEESLWDRGLQRVAARDLIAQIVEATEAADYWNQGDQGLAIFASLERLDLVRLPQPVAQTWFVGRNFLLTPLLDFETDGSFAVLALSKNQCRLLRGDRWTLQPVTVPGLPARESEALPTADHQHTASAHGGVQHGKSRQTVLTGQGGAADFAKPEFLAYCRQVNTAVCRFLKPASTPLVLACVRNEVPLYREVNHYTGLQPATIDGNPDSQSLSELHRRAWEIAAPVFAANEQRVLERCVVQTRQNRAGGGLHEIVQAAHEGRIETLLLSPTTQCWGAFEPDTGHCRLMDSHCPGGEDLLNLAAIETLRHGGDVYAADLAQAGIHDPAAAIFKFADRGVRPRASKSNRANPQQPA